MWRSMERDSREMVRHMLAVVPGWCARLCSRVSVRQAKRINFPEVRVESPHTQAPEPYNTPCQSIDVGSVRVAARELCYSLQGLKASLLRVHRGLFVTRRRGLLRGLPRVSSTAGRPL